MIISKKIKNNTIDYTEYKYNKATILRSIVMNYKKIEKKERNTKRNKTDVMGKKINLEIKRKIVLT